MIKSLGKLGRLLPESLVYELRRLRYRRQILVRRFVTDEPEFGRLAEWVSEGDCVLDLGANVGHYTCRLSELVGASGRVIAVEPVPSTFSMLTANSRHFAHSNVTLLNVGASDTLRLAGLSIPEFSTGMTNYYMARLVEDGSPMLSALVFPLGFLVDLPRVSLVKIDTEGHEGAVVRGLWSLIERHRPHLIIEAPTGDLVNLLAGLGYKEVALKGSPNKVFTVSSDA